MSRGQGRAYQRGNVWWLDYSVNGARFRGPTTAATGNETLSGGLRWLHKTQYDIDGLRSKERIQQSWKQIEKFFPPRRP